MPTLKTDFCFLFVIFMLWLISWEVKKTGEQMRADTSIEKYIPYNPTLPLLQQSEDTKQELIKLFS